MQPMVIPCPRCGSKLKLRDPSLLGKTGNCPQCNARFELSVPLATSEDPAEITAPPGRAVESADCPPETDSINIDLAPEKTGTGRLAERRRQERDRKRRLTWFLAALGIAGVAAGLTSIFRGDAREQPLKPKLRIARTLRQTSSKAADSLAPAIKRGPPIDLRYVPHGAAMLINFRPAELWAMENSPHKLLACCGERFATWSSAGVNSRCLFEPHEIEEAKLCLYFSAPGEPYRMAGVVRLSAPIKHSELLKHFNGTRRDDIGLPYYVGETTSYLLIDEQSFAFCPTAMAEDWKETVGRPATTKESLFRVLRNSDRLDQLTVVFEPADVRLHAESLVPPNAIDLVLRIVDWFHEDVETVCWGMRLEDSFHSRVLLRGRTSFEQARIERMTENNLKETPGRILETVRGFRPGPLGTKRVIGRFPAMSLACRQATRISREDGQVQLETRLPTIAAPNLLLASRLLWQESVKSESAEFTFGTVPRETPVTVAGRLAMRINCDFRRTPLHEAVAFIGKEIGVEFELAGNDLKLIGVTQNMPQEFALHQVPATAVLHRMLAKIGLVIVVNESQNRIVVTSATAAKERGETVFPLSGGKEPEKQ